LRVRFRSLAVRALDACTKTQSNASLARRISMFGLNRYLSRKYDPVRKQSFKPRFEALEQREVMSASSPGIHAVAENFGTSAVFYINEQNHAFYEHDALHGTRMLSGPNTVQAFSAGLDTNGRADVFVKAGDGSFWEFSDFRGGWHELLGPGVVQSFAAVKGDRVYVQFQDNSVREFNGANFLFQWSWVSAVGTVQSLDAVTDTHGFDAVYVLKTNDTFGELYHGVYKQLAGAFHLFKLTLPSVNQFSAGTDLNGNADVYARFFLGNLEKNVGGVWTSVAAAGTFKEFSATDSGQVWFIASDNTLKKFDAAGVRHDVYNGDFVSISAARSNDVYVVNWDDSLWERTGGGVWNEWSGAGTVAQ
jgi:hypothetical protein